MSAAMIPPSDPLHPPLAVAALASAWPRLRVLADREAAVLDALTTLQRVAGDVPQADVIEPFDPDAGEPWELRCDLPDLSADTWQALRDALRHHEHELSPGAPPEVTRADDLGVRLCDWLDGDGLSARMIVGTADGEQSLDLRRSSRADADIEVLERQLAEALHEAHPSLRLTSDRGHDTVTPVVHRTSGRLGLELYIGPEVWQGLNGDEVLALRRTAVDALASVVHERRLHPTLQLAPDVLWGTRLGGMVLLVWIVAAHVGALPGDEPVASGLSKNIKWIWKLYGTPARVSLYAKAPENKRVAKRIRVFVVNFGPGLVIGSDIDEGGRKTYVKSRRETGRRKPRQRIKVRLKRNLVMFRTVLDLLLQQAFVRFVVAPHSLALC